MTRTADAGVGARAPECAHLRAAATGGMDAHAHAHHDGHDHAHDHGHDHAHATSTRALRWALVLTAVLLVAEVVGGIVSNSLALLADAGHMLTDVGALGLSLFVAWFSRQPSSPSKTYGYLRWEILAAFLNGAALLLISALIVWEAIGRFRSPEPLAAGTMLGVAIAGLAVNVASAWMLHGSAHTSLNVRGAYLHVLGDLLGSVGTVAAALIVRSTGWLAADPLVSILTTVLIVRGAWRLVHESVDVLLEGVPPHISLAAVRGRLESVVGVESVHDLHVWSVTSGLVAMSAHAVVPELERQQPALEAMHAAMAELGIRHVTVQLERQTIEPCAPPV
ncbi:cation diffusion facilitator family transporter [Roseisolibacter agri]|uniref:Cation transporter n=1 Tax=Roseisolibacter agri TaxID=2014610 RepID=A0AA37V4M7_9BACT|nr:cation diffusion facilitator family transporter [Roseisolibacter agri]GLC28137.1 cation transporter [Roseisolibacter agri]